MLMDYKGVWDPVDQWYKAINQAIVSNRLAPETWTEVPLYVVCYEETVGDGPISNDDRVCVYRELKYENLVLARLSRTGLIYKAEAFVCEELLNKK